MAETVLIERRFRGPPESANGGYACGLLARYVAGSAEISLRKPPPLDVPMEVRTEGETVSMLAGDQVIAEARPSPLELEVVEPVGLEEAARATERYAGFSGHPFPGCFVCGPERAAGDGLRVFPGKVEGCDALACAWTPDESVADDDGCVAWEVIWGVLDCPTGFGSGLGDEHGPSVLARLRGQVHERPKIGERHIVMAWSLGGEGRKWEGASAVFTDRGELIARARGLWIELPK